MAKNGAGAGSSHPTRRDIVAGGVALPVVVGIPREPQPNHQRRWRTQRRLW